MSKVFDEVKGFLPQLRGMVDDRVDKALYIAFLRVYEYVNNKLAESSNATTKQIETRTKEIVTQTTELVNNFVTKLITNKGNGKNPLESLGVGTVTSISANGNILFTVGGSPITESGTFTFTLSNQAANKIFAGPTTGAAASPTFRALVKEDINIPFKLTTSTNADPTTTEYANQEWGLHKNTTSGDVTLAYNDGGIIKKILLT